MSVYMISYDLNKAGKNYEGVFKAIKDASTGGNSWMHPLDSTWVIKSALSAETISNRIRAQTDGDDSWLLFEVTKNVAGELRTQHLCNYLAGLLTQ